MQGLVYAIMIDRDTIFALMNSGRITSLSMADIGWCCCYCCDLVYLQTKSHHPSMLKKCQLTELNIAYRVLCDLYSEM